MLGEYDRNEAEPGFEFIQKSTALLYPGQGSRKNTIGDRDVIAKVTPEQMRYIQKKYYVPNNSTLIVTGDVDPEKVFALAEKYYGDWPRGADPFVADPIPPIPALDSNKSLIVEQPINAVAVLIQWQGPSVGKDPAATFAADVFSDALNTPGSTFQKNLCGHGVVAGHRRQLLHAQSGGADLDQRTNNAREIPSGHGSARTRNRPVYRPHVRDAARTGSGQGAAHHVECVWYREGLRNRAHHRFLVERRESQ